MNRIMKKMDFCIEFIGCISFVMMIIFTMGNVISDWTVGKRFAQLDEIVQSFYVWVTYVGIGLLYKNGEQMHVDLLVNLMSERLKKLDNIFVDIVTFVTSCIMMYLAWTLAIKSTNKTTAVMKIPYTIIDFALVVGFFTMILYILAKFVGSIIGGRKND